VLVRFMDAKGVWANGHGVPAEMVHRMAERWKQLPMPGLGHPPSATKLELPSLRGEPSALRSQPLNFPKKVIGRKLRRILTQ
jgi:hypothetical protein